MQDISLRCVDIQRFCSASFPTQVEENSLARSLKEIPSSFNSLRFFKHFLEISVEFFKISNKFLQNFIQILLEFYEDV